MQVNPNDTSHDLLVLNGINSDNAQPVDDDVIALAIEKIESIQNLDAGLTGCFTDTNSEDSQKFISFLIKAGFQKLAYDGFVRQEAVMVFRPQSALLS